MARLLSQAGADLVIADIQSAKAEAVAAAIRKDNGHASAQSIDVRQDESVCAGIRTVLHHQGRIDILVNSAGIIRRPPVECITSQDWDEVLAVNVKGAFFASRTVMPSMQQPGKGRIINIASNSGKTGALVAGFHYAAPKAAVIGLTKSFARLLAGSGVTVNAVSPGPTMTPAVADLSQEETAHLQAYIPLGRLASPGEIAGAVVFLASDLSSFMTEKSWTSMGA